MPEEEIHIRSGMDRDLEDALASLERRVESASDSLDDMGRRGSAAGDAVEDGMDTAGRAAGQAERSLSSAARQAERTADEMRDMTEAGRRAASGLEAVEDGAEAAEDALSDAARAAGRAERALDDAGDEAAESGRQAAMAATGWDRLDRIIARNERTARLWNRTHGGVLAMQRRVRTVVDASSRSFRGLLDLDWKKSAKEVGGYGKALGGFSTVFKVFMGLLKIALINAAIGAIAALGAGLVVVISQLAGMTRGLLAFVPLLGAAKVAMLAFKAAAEAVQPEMDALKTKFDGIGEAVAEGGLRKGLRDLIDDVDGFVGVTEIGMGRVGAALGRGASALGRAANDQNRLDQVSRIFRDMEPILDSLIRAALDVAIAFLTIWDAAGPVGVRLAQDIGRLADQLRTFLDVQNSSGALTRWIAEGYDQLKAAIGVVVDFVIGLYNIFRIAAGVSTDFGFRLGELASNFRTWTQSVEGENAIRKYFTDAMPAFEQAILLVRDLLVLVAGLATAEGTAPLLEKLRTETLPALAEAMATISDQGGLLPNILDSVTELANLFTSLDLSGLTMLAAGLAAAVGWIADLIENTPGLSTLVSTLALLWVVGGAAFTVIGAGMNAFAWIAGARTLTEDATNAQRIWNGVLRAWNTILFNIRSAYTLLTATMMANTGTTTVWAAAMVYARNIVSIFQLWMTGLRLSILSATGATTLWGAALYIATLPITWIIIAIVALVAIFIWAYNNVDWFREGVNAALKAVGDFFVWLWNDIIVPAFHAAVAWIIGAVGWLVDAWNWLVATAQAVWTAIVDALVAAWNFMQPIFQVIWTIIKVIGAVIFTLLVAPWVIAFNLILKPLIQLFGLIFSYLWTEYIRPTIDNVVGAWNFLVEAWQIAVAAIQLYLILLRAQFNAWYAENVQPVVDWVVGAWNWLVDQFNIGVTNISIFIEDMKAQFNSWWAENVQPIINYVVAYWNYLTLMIGAYVNLFWQYIEYMKAQFNAWWAENVQPIIDQVVSKWEWLMGMLQSVKTSTWDPLMENLRIGLDTLRGWFDSAVNTIGDIWNGLKRRFADPINFLINAVWNDGVLAVWNWIASKIGLPTGDEIPEITGYAVGGPVRGAGTGTSDSIPAMLSNNEHVWTEREVRAVGGHQQMLRLRQMARDGRLNRRVGYYAAGGPVTPQEMHAAVTAALPGTRLTSGFRQGDDGFHGRNRAADLAGPRSMDTAFMGRINGWIANNFGGSSELIYTPGINLRNGSPHNYSAAVRADHYDHVHWANNGGGSGGGGIIGGILAAGWNNWAKPILDGMINPVLGLLPSGPPEWLEVPKRTAFHLKDRLWAWAEEQINAWGGSGNGSSGMGGDPGANVEQWRGVVMQALGMLGLSGSLANTTLRRMNQESGGNARAINNWDSNARRGTPSKGLMQVIDPTFRANRDHRAPNDIWNPLANILASMRYALGRYGSLPAAYDRRGGYDNGGWLMPGRTLVDNDSGVPEPVFNGSQWSLLSGILERDAEPVMVSDRASGMSAADAADMIDSMYDMIAALDERPPAIVASSDEVRREVESALRKRERERRVQARNKY